MTKIREGDIVRSEGWPERCGIVMYAKPIGCDEKDHVLVKWNYISSGMASLLPSYIREEDKKKLVVIEKDD